MENNRSICLDRIMRIIVIGNSPQLLLAAKGRDIDSFDVVIRTGNFILDGFKQYTGTKTSIWCNRWCKMMDHPSTGDILSDVSQVWLSDIDQREFDQQPVEYVSHVNKKTQVRYFSKQLLTANLHEYEPTLGMIGVLMALNIYSQHDVSITGFGVDITSSNFVGTYWNQQYNRRTKESHHSFLRESILLKKMIHNDVIKQL